MKAAIIQAPYSRDLSKSDEYFDYKLNLLKDLKDDVDIIILPEYSDVPCATTNLEETLFYHDKYIGTLLSECENAAKRCNALLFVNALSKEEGGYRNTTYVYGRDGKLLGKYFKKHLPPLELETLALDSDYTFTYSEPFTMDIEGLRYAFLTCYDFYFYEATARIARENVDVIIGCSLQRSDTHSAIEIMCRHLAYNTNAYVLRSSVSFAEDSDICGASMAVTPKGDVLLNMKGKFGVGYAEFDPSDKYLKPAGFGRKDAPHYEYIEYGRKPWQYRSGGSAIVPFEEYMPYPRVCAHRGFSFAAPENTMPAYGAAIGMGADEIELDLWPTTDHELISCHDKFLHRISNGEGPVTDKSLAELKELDFGCKFSDSFKGLKLVTFEEILKHFAGHTIMNVHLKPMDEEEFPDWYVDRLLYLIRKYEAERHVYLMVEEDKQIAHFKRIAPEIPICVGHNKNDPWGIVDRAIRLGAEKVQFYRPYINQEMIDKARANGVICNLFHTDDPDEAIEFIKMGIDTILTNNFCIVQRAVNDYLGK
ncbi:MAG: hypothetical protein IJD97_09635 [Clostridia bacterium]|nr:hypothetical protein [Clostridia bacterium]